MSSVVGGIACSTCLPSLQHLSITLGCCQSNSCPFSLSCSASSSANTNEQRQTPHRLLAACGWRQSSYARCLCVCECVCKCVCLLVCSCECMMSWWISWLAWLTLSLSLATWRLCASLSTMPESECLNYWSNRCFFAASPFPYLSNSRQRLALAVLSCLPNYLRNYEHVARSATAASQGQQSGDVVRLVVVAVVVVASAKLILKHISLSSLSMRPPPTCLAQLLAYSNDCKTLRLFTFDLL